MEHLTCQIDRASKIEMEFTQDSEKAIRALVPEEKPELTEEDLECTQCSGPINPLRAAKGFDLCIDCARDNERFSKQKYKRDRYSDFDD